MGCIVMSVAESKLQLNSWQSVSSEFVSYIVIERGILLKDQKRKEKGLVEQGVCVTWGLTVQKFYRLGNVMQYFVKSQITASLTCVSAKSQS